ncbi:hypothetical protein FA15DRAFT_705872 [Coprinopsis marcescibilis]|uniref:Nucleoplasmin-like domain-containing protein n=1 Tax=Coprinopsis marcescibilis TaxID=230819 RepID=A0A5C3KQU7_COPMA|nr:hypothetical protein FA15DRAFT_705872 [Coprinopsis marcescibilis]
MSVATIPSSDLWAFSVKPGEVCRVTPSQVMKVVMMSLLQDIIQSEDQLILYCSCLLMNSCPRNTKLISQTVLGALIPLVLEQVSFIALYLLPNMEYTFQIIGSHMTIDMTGYFIEDPCTFQGSTIILCQIKKRDLPLVGSQGLATTSTSTGEAPVTAGVKRGCEGTEETEGPEVPNGKKPNLSG